MAAPMQQIPVGFTVENDPEGGWVGRARWLTRDDEAREGRWKSRDWPDDANALEAFVARLGEFHASLLADDCMFFTDEAWDQLMAGRLLPTPAPEIEVPRA